VAEIPAWKKRPQTAGAMMLIKGYVDPVTHCDACGHRLEDAEGMIKVTFKEGHAHYHCVYCGSDNTRPIRREEHRAEPL